MRPDRTVSKEKCDSRRRSVLHHDFVARRWAAFVNYVVNIHRPWRDGDGHADFKLGEHSMRSDFEYELIIEDEVVRVIQVLRCKVMIGRETIVRDDQGECLLQERLFELVEIG